MSKNKNLLNTMMKKSVLLLTLFLLFYVSGNGQTTKGKTMKTDENLQKRISEIEDRIALKELVDTFSILADVKDVPKQVLLFTENAVVESVTDGKPGTPYNGRKQIGDAFSNFLSLFDVVYHINGQQTLTLNGDKASGISYCQVTLIGTENGRQMKTTMGVFYHDDYVRENGRWLIAKRKSNFAWRDKTEMGR
jgi:hypothetical protein